LSPGFRNEIAKPIGHEIAKMSFGCTPFRVVQVVVGAIKGPVKLGETLCAN